MNKYKIILITFFIIFLLPVFVYADNNGFVKDENGNIYYYRNGEKQYGTQYIDKKYYYFDENGVMQFGVTDGTYYYGRVSGTRQKNYWYDENNDGKFDSYFGSDYKIVDGINKIDGKYYYFINNRLQYGVTDGTYYYGRASGTRQYSYLWDKNDDGTIDSYFDKNGKILKSSWLDIDNDKKNDYYFDKNGQAVNNVQQVGDNYYYFINNRLQYGVVNGLYYYGRASGTRQKNYWYDENNDGKYDSYFGSDYKIVDGVNKIDGKYYYFINNRLQYGVVNGLYYYGRASGTRQKNYWYDENNDGKFDSYFGSDYKIVDGINKIDGNYYYFINNRLQYGVVNGLYYYGRASGTRQKNYWYDENNDGKFDSYFGSDYKIVDGINKIDGKYYYFINNKLQYGVTDGTYYYGRASGARQYSYLWDKNDDGTIDSYFDKNGKILKSSWLDIDNDKKNDYYFDKNGQAVNNVQQVGDNYYYFINNRLQYGVVDGLYYYGKASGTRQKNYWYDENNDGKYDSYFGSDYKIVDGINKIDGKYYYFINNKLQYGVTDGTYYYGRASGTRQYNYLWDSNGDGKYNCYYKEDGKKVYNYWLDINKDKKNDYYFNELGEAVDGVVEIDNTFYYFINNVVQYGKTDGTYYYGRVSGTRQKNYWYDSNEDGKFDYYFNEDYIMVKGDQIIDGNYYYFNDKGKLQYGVFRQIGESTYYYGNATGKRQYGWIHKDNQLYYFNLDTGAMVTGDVVIDGNSYRFNNKGQLQNGWQTINGETYYFYADGSRAINITKIADTRYEFSSTGKLQHRNVRLVVDVSAYQGAIDWDGLWSSGQIDGVILRVAAGAEYEDTRLADYISNIKRLNIPMGLYIYSYAENYNEGVIYGNFMKNVINKYSLNPVLGIYLDLESNKVTSYMGPSQYTEVVNGFLSVIPNAKLYTYLNYANSALNTEFLRSKITWIAHYSTDCGYQGSYSGWQYTSKGKLPGINGNVDLSVFY